MNYKSLKNYTYKNLKKYTYKQLVSNIVKSSAMVVINVVLKINGILSKNELYYDSLSNETYDSLSQYTYEEISLQTVNRNIVIENLVINGGININ